VESPAGPIPTLPFPVSIAGARPSPRPIPALGEHTDAILAELGLTDTEIASLHDAGAV